MLLKPELLKRKTFGQAKKRERRSAKVKKVEKKKG